MKKEDLMNEEARAQFSIDHPDLPELLTPTQFEFSGVETKDLPVDKQNNWEDSEDENYLGDGVYLNIN